MKKKVQDEVAKAILSRNETPVSISEQKDLVSKIKAETAQTLRKRDSCGLNHMQLDRSPYFWTQMAANSGNREAMLCFKILVRGTGCHYLE